MYLYNSLIFPRDSLHSQEFFDSRTAVEAAETALLGASVGKIRLVVDGHTVDVDGTIVFTSAMIKWIYLCSSHAKGE